MKTAATSKDIGNVEAWVEVLQHVFALIPLEARVEVASQLADAVAKKARKFEAGGGVIVRCAADAAEEYEKSPAFRWHGAIKRLKALTIQVLARSITNNNSPRDAAALLFAQQHYGTGSGCLSDYLNNLPGVQIRR
jgi:hypothetical protein